jgi:replication initiation and membrane attachment protein
MLLIDINLQTAVVNVLIDYVLKRNNNKLNQAFVETIASQWKRCKVETASEAMELAKKENNKYNKKIETTKPARTIPQNDKVPVWFNQEITKEEMSADELAELERQLNEFR